MRNHKWNIRTAKIAQYEDPKQAKWRLTSNDDDNIQSVLNIIDQQDGEAIAESAPAAPAVTTISEGDTPRQPGQKRRKPGDRDGQSAMFKYIKTEVEKSVDRTSVLAAAGTITVTQDEDDLHMHTLSMNVQEIPEHLRNPSTLHDSAGNEWSKIGPPSLDVFLKQWQVEARTVPTGFYPIKDDDPSCQKPEMRRVYEWHRTQAQTAPPRWAEVPKTHYVPEHQLPLPIRNRGAAWLEAMGINDVQTCRVYPDFTTDPDELCRALGVDMTVRGYKRALKDAAHDICNFCRWNGAVPKGHTVEKSHQIGAGCKQASHAWFSI